MSDNNKGILNKIFLEFFSTGGKPSSNLNKSSSIDDSVNIPKINPPIINEPINIINPPIINEPINKINPPIINEPINIINPPIINEPINKINPPIINEPINIINPPIINEPINKINPPIIQIGGNDVIKKFKFHLQSGGSIKPLSSNYGKILYKRIFLIAFIFFIAVYCASVTFMSHHIITQTLKLSGESENSDPNFDNDEETIIQRWKRVMKIIIIFSLLTISYYIAFIIAIILILAFYFMFAKKEGEKIWSLIKTILLNLFWRFNTDKKEHVLLYFYIIIILIIIIPLMFFMLYHLFVKNYLINLYYSSDVDSSKNNKSELLNSTKFALYYGQYIMLLFLFFLVLFTIYHLSGDSLMFICLFIIIVIMMFIMLIYKYTLQRSNFKIFTLWFVFFIYIICTYILFGIQSD
jgi:hypothetical protein